MRIPQLCHHKATGRAYARFQGQAVYFCASGEWPAKNKTPPVAAVQAYEAYLAEWLRGRPLSVPRVRAPRSASVDELWEAYHQHATTYYVKNGKPTDEIYAIRTACRIAARTYGDKPARDFDRACLSYVRDEMVRKGWARKSINKQVGRVLRMFRWAAEEGTVPEEVYFRLRLLRPLKKGRTPARETPKVKPVPWETVERTLPLLRPVLAAMVRVHYLLGCRSEDVVEMRPCDLDTSGAVWLFTPRSFKSEHHEDAEALVYWVGPKAQAVLAPLLERCPSSSAYVFPTAGTKAHGPHRRGCYSTNSYRRRVTLTCDRAGIPRWTPLQLRHSRLTEVRKLHGIEAARVVAMHRNLSTAEIYAEANLEKSRSIMAEIG